MNDARWYSNAAGVRPHTHRGERSGLGGGGTWTGCPLPAGDRSGGRELGGGRGKLSKYKDSFGPPGRGTKWLGRTAGSPTKHGRWRGHIWLLQIPLHKRVTFAAGLLLEGEAMISDTLFEAMEDVTQGAGGGRGKLSVWKESFDHHQRNQYRAVRFKIKPGARWEHGN